MLLVEKLLQNMSGGITRQKAKTTNMVSVETS